MRTLGSGALPRSRRVAGEGEFAGLLDGARRRQSDALRALHDAVVRPVAAYLRTNGAADPAGTTNEVMFRALTNLHRFEGDEDRFRAWVLTIAHHRLVDERRSRSRRPPEVGFTGDEDSVVAPDDPVATVEASAATWAVLDAIADLPESQRTVITLRWVGGLSLAEVADILGCQVGAVKALQHRGVESLRARLGRVSQSLDLTFTASMTAAAPTGATAFADELRAVVPEVADAFDAAFVELMDRALPVWDDRLAELLATPAEAADAADTAEVAVASGDAELTGQVVPFARSRRRLAHKAVVVGGAVSIVVAATTGLAAASVLPGPVQRAVAEVASHVGIGLPSPRPDATSSFVVPSTTVPPSTTLAPTTTAAPTTAGAPATTSGASRAGSTANSPAPAPSAVAPTADRAGFLAAVAAFRACLAGSERGARDCTPPDPAAFGVAASSEPADVHAFRAAIAAYWTCLRAARSSTARAACVRPDPASYGLGRPAASPSPPTGTAPSPVAVEALRKALVAYGTCLTAARTPAELRLCAPPNPYDFGLSAWPPGLVLPHRPSATSRPAASSPPVDARPPARTPGAAGSSASWTGSRPRR